MIVRLIHGKKRPEGWVERKRRFRKMFVKTEQEATDEKGETRELPSGQEG